MTVAQLPTEDLIPKPKRARVENWPVMSFSEENKVGTVGKIDVPSGKKKDLLH